MKKYLNGALILLPLVMAWGLGSCLKDPGRLDFSGSGPVIEFPQPYTQAGKNLRILNPQVLSTPQVYPFDLNLASPNVLPYDVVATVGVDPNGIKAFTAMQQAAGDSTVYTVPPSSSFTITPTQVIIHKGTRIDSLALSITTAGLDLTQAYIIPLIITAVTPANVVISGNFGRQYVKVAPKNQYDGVYSEVGIFTRLGVARAIEAASPTKNLSTVNGNTVATYLADITSDPITLTINADNSVTVTGQGNTPALAFPGPNTYDPAKKVLTLNYSYGAGSRTGTETLTYSGPRP